jgi:hypothetical protein
VLTIVSNDVKLYNSFEQLPNGDLAILTKGLLIAMFEA